jgi:hypothetical protein
MSQFEQQENVKFCQKLGKSSSETFQMVKQAYSKEALGRSAVFKWHKRFAQGRDSLEDHEHTSQPRMVRTELRSKELQLWCVPTTPKRYMKLQQQLGLTTVLGTKFCLMT